MSNLHLLLGPEIGEKKQFIENIIDTHSKKIGEKPEIHKLYPFEKSLSDIVSLLRNKSLFSPYKIILLENAESIPKTTELKELIEYIKKPADDTTLVLISEKTSLDNKKLEKVIPRDSKKIFWEMFENRKNAWIIQFFKKRNRKISAEAVDELLELITNNTEEMKEACNKLCFHYAEEHEITAEDVDRIIYHSKQETVFSLYDKIISNDVEGALEILETMILAHQAEPIPVLAGLSWQFQRFLKYRIILEQTKSGQQAANESGIRAKRAQATHLKASENFSIKDIQEIISQIAKADRHVRESGKSFHKAEMQLLIYSILNPTPVNRLT